MVAGRKRRQRDLLITCLFAQAFGLSFYGVYVFFSERAIDKTCLAESAASYAAPENFDDCSVVDYLREWDDESLGIIHIVKVRNNTFSYPCRCLLYIRRDSFHRTIVVICHIVKLRDIHSLEFYSFSEKFVFRAALPFHIFIKLEQFYVDLFTLTDYEQVKKVCHRLGIAHTRTAADNYRHSVVTLSGKHGNARKIEHFKHIVIG